MATEPDTKLVPRNIPQGQLQIDPAYQRVIVERQVAWIEKHMDWVAFGRVLVGRRSDGQLWVVDGQQRLTAARRLGVEEIPCLLFDSRGRQHEAQVFKEINANRTGVRPMEVFKAALEARDPETVAVAAVTQECGYKITTAPINYAAEWAHTRCVATLVRVYRRGGADLLRQTLGLIRDLWEGDADATNATVIDGVGFFLHRVPEFDRKTLTQKLNKHKPAELLRFVKDATSLGGAGNHRGSLFAGAMVNVYNRSKKKNSPGRISLSKDARAEADPE